MVNLTAFILSVIVVLFIVFITASVESSSFTVPTLDSTVFTLGEEEGLLPAIQPVSTPYASGSMDILDTTLESGAQNLGTAVLANYMAQAQSDPIELECPETEVPCPQEVVWRNSFPGCGSFFVPIEGKDYFKDDRLWQGDLNPKIQERYAVMAKEWDPYQYMNSRQAWMQFIATNNSTQSDKYMRAIDDITDVDTTRVTDIEPVPVY